LAKLNAETSKKNLLDVSGGPKTVSIQICFHKIPNMINEKPIVCSLPYSLHTSEANNMPEACLIVKDLDKKDRDYEKTQRKYQAILEKNKLTDIVKQIMPLKQINLEFRHFEAKRKLCTSFDMFLADKCLYDILNHGSKLGKEFIKRRKMPLFIDISDEKQTLSDKVRQVLDSTLIRLNGKGPMVDVQAFLSDHNVSQAMANIAAIKTALIKHLPAGEANIKAIYLKTTNGIAVPLFFDNKTDMNKLRIPSNMTPRLVKKSQKLSVKRLTKKKEKTKRIKARAAAAIERSLLTGDDTTAADKDKTKSIKTPASTATPTSKTPTPTTKTSKKTAEKPAPPAAKVVVADSKKKRVPPK